MTPTTFATVLGNTEAFSKLTLEQQEEAKRYCVNRFGRLMFLPVALFVFGVLTLIGYMHARGIPGLQINAAWIALVILAVIGSRSIEKTVIGYAFRKYLSTRDLTKG